MQLNLQEERKKLEETISGLSCTHFTIGSNKNIEVTLALLEMGMCEFGMGRGANLSEGMFNQRLVRSVLLLDDQAEIVEDIAYRLNQQIDRLIPRTILQHRFGFKILGNGNVLVALDPRDLEPLTPEEISDSEGTGVECSPHQDMDQFDQYTEV